MQINITKAFSLVLKTMPTDEYDEIVSVADILRAMSKTEIINKKSTIPLFENNGVTLYGHKLSDLTYILFTFFDKNTLILCDKIQLIDDDNIKSWTYE